MFMFLKSFLGIFTGWKDVLSGYMSD